MHGRVYVWKFVGDLHIKNLMTFKQIIFYISVCILRQLKDIDDTDNNGPRQKQHKQRGNFPTTKIAANNEVKI